MDAHEHFARAQQRLAERPDGADPAWAIARALQGLAHATLALAAAGGADRQAAAQPAARPEVDTTLPRHVLGAFEPEEDDVDLPTLAARLADAHPDRYGEITARQLAALLHEAPWRVGTRQRYAGRENGSSVYRRAIVRGDLEHAVDRHTRP